MLEGAGCMAGGSDFRAASGASGIGGLDHGTEECPDGLLLFADAACLGRICRSTNETAVALLCARVGSLRAGAFS